MFDSLFASMNFTNSKDRNRVRDLFELYMSDLPNNFYENQFSLATKYAGTEYTEWVRILTYPAFQTWKNTQVGIIASTSTDKALAGESGTNKEAFALLGLRQEILTKENQVAKPTIIVLPEELFFKEDT